MRRRAAVVLWMLAIAACGGAKKEAEKPPAPARETVCHAQRPAGAAEATTATVTDAAPSLVVVHADVALASIAGPLEAKVPRRVAEERDHDIGMAGRLEYVVDRGPISTNAQGDSLFVVAPLVAHARACARGSCYAGCDPEARVTVRVPLRLGPDWELRRASAHVEVTKGCVLAALGGIVRIDVTPIIEGRLAAETKRIEDTINRELPKVRPDAERLWQAMAATRPLPFGACVRMNPESIVQGPPSGEGTTAHLRFGVVARPTLYASCGTDAAPIPPLPALKDDDALAKDGEMHLAEVLPAYAACGDAAPVPIADVAWSNDGRALAIDGGRATLDVPLTPDSVTTTLPALASAASDDHITVAARIADAHAESATVRDGSVVAIVRARGAVDLHVK